MNLRGRSADQRLAWGFMVLIALAATGLWAWQLQRSQLASLSLEQRLRSIMAVLVGSTAPCATVAPAVDATTSMADWTRPDCPLLARLRQHLGQRTQWGFPPDLVLWYQGEADARLNHFITHNFIYALQVDDLTKESSDELGCRGVCDGGFGRQEAQQAAGEARAAAGG